MNVKSLPTIVIVGLPNAGKSTLFNRLAGRRQAIIADEAGTTRDLVQADCVLGGKAVHLIDTAGLMKPSGEIEQDAQTKIEQALASANVILLVVDAATPPSQTERQLAARLHKAGKPLILVMAKADQREKLDPSEFAAFGIKQMFATSSIHNTGTEELARAIAGWLPKSDAAARVPEIEGISVALIGRPNVGKSSLINKLSGTDLAIVNEQAGTTRDTNQSTIEHKGETITLTDTAGIRRAGKVGKGVEFFSVNRAQSAIDRVDVCIALVDASEGLTAQDVHVLGQAKEAGKGLIIAINKWDTMNDEYEQAQLLSKLKRSLQFAWWAPVIYISAATGHNTNKLLDTVIEVHKRMGIELRTTELNKLVQEAMAKHPPSGRGNIHPKLNYVTQTGTNPPKLTFFGAHTEDIHFSYPRYLENRLREQFDLTGVPVVIEMKSKYKDKTKG